LTIASEMAAPLSQSLSHWLVVRRCENMLARISAEISRGHDSPVDRSHAEPAQIIPSAVTGAACGALMMFFFDPERGHGRRTLARDRLQAIGRRGLQRWNRLTRGLTAQARGRILKIQHRQP